MLNMFLRKKVLFYREENRFDILVPERNELS